jgi:diacylglycerol kinase family enzyme
MPVIENGKHLDKNLSFIKYSQTNNIILESETEFSGQRDGEYITGKCFVIECLPDKFTFIY